MYSFTYHAPTTLDEALAALAEADDPKLLAGGQTLIPTMKQRLAMPGDLVSIGDIAELKGIEVKDGHLVIGACERHADVAASDVVHHSIPALAHLAEQIGDPHVRHMGTFGGSIANNDPSADYPAAALALGATIETSQTRILADDFFTGTFETALDERDIVLRGVFPVPEQAAYVKFPNPASRYAMVGVFVARFGDRVRVAVTGAGAAVFRVPVMEEALTRDFSPEAVPVDAVSAADLISDLHASADYRAALIPVLARRAVALAQQS